MSKITRVVEQLVKAQSRVAKLEAEYSALRLQTLKQVEMTKTGESVTLTFGDQVFKAKKPARFTDRWNISKNGVKIATECFGSIHDIRFAIAMGDIK